ncbi:hypothetical protein STEG23_032265, partial [Scotinomys teguina]
MVTSRPKLLMRHAYRPDFRIRRWQLTVRADGSCKRENLPTGGRTSAGDSNRAAGDLSCLQMANKFIVERSQVKQIKVDCGGFEMAIQDISTYFSEEEWAKLTRRQKRAYVYKKRNYLRKIALGVTVKQPVFMCRKQRTKDSLVKCTPVHGRDIEDPLKRKTMSSCFKSPVEATHGPKNMSEAIQDISTYFSEEEWAKLTKWQKSAYVYMKRNYLRMTSLGVTVNKPVFMRPKQQAKDSLVKCTTVHGCDIEDPLKMKTMSSCFQSPVEATHGPKIMSEAFQDISTYFSEEEWAKLNKWQKSAYVYMKRNYLRMTGLGVTVKQPVFMRPKQQAKDSLVKCTTVHGRDIEDPLYMKTLSSCFENSMEANHGPKSMCEAFQDISTYFSEEEWAKLNKWQKSAYVYMKRNYLRMTGL